MITILFLYHNTFCDVTYCGGGGGGGGGGGRV
jgi:hypothetical protein